MLTQRLWTMAVSATALLFLSAAAPVSPSPFTYLNCDFKKTQFVVGFAQNPSRIVDGINPDVTLKDIRVTDQIISFGSDNPFYSHGYYSKWFPDSAIKDAASITLSINRLTGIAVLSFFKQYGAEEKAACTAKSDGSAPWCNYPPKTGEVDGTCSKVVKRF